MKLQSILATAVAALLIFSGCSSDNDGPTDKTDGAKSLVSVAFTLPGATPTRAQTEQNATEKESNVTDVAVFIFDAAGAAVTEGDYSYFPRADFGPTAPYTLNTGKEITTVSGAARIYIGINLPGHCQHRYANESALLAAVASLEEIMVDNDFTMISEAKVASLQSTEDLAVNVVPVSVDRVVSKVVGSFDPAGTYTSTWKASEVNPAAPTSFIEDVTFTYEPLSYGVYQYAIKTYLAKNQSTLINYLAETSHTAAEVVKPFGYADGGNSTLYSGHQDADPTNGRKDWIGVYVGENMPAATLFGNTTYTYIATKVTISHYAEWDDTGKKVVYKTGTYPTHVWVVNYDGIDVLTNSKDNADAIYYGLNSLEPGVKEATIYLYYQGIVHFRTYLNKNGSNDYRVGRNEYIHMRVNSIKPLTGGIFPGNPGKEDDPENHPVDPNDIDPTPPGPKPTDPTQPIDPEEAMLSVTITVKPWAYKANDISLQ